MIEKQKIAQEEEYWFPYHYISKRAHHGFSQHFVDTWGVNYVSTIEFMLQRVQLLSPKSIVDIGCGDGRFTRELSLDFPGCEVVGIDFSERAIALAKSMNHDLRNIDFQATDITRSGIGRKFDVAILMEVYEHIPLEETREFLKGVRNLITGDGLLLLTVPHSNKPIEYKHFQHFTISSIKDQLAHEFEIAEVVPFEKRGLARRLLNLLLCNRLFVLNNGKTLAMLYWLHEKFLFNCQSETNCQRIFVMAKARQQR